jgi:hypothetical protein
MNKTVRNTGLILLAAGALVYPAMRLYQYWNKRRKEEMDGDEQPHKAILGAYRGNHKPHRRKAHAEVN